MTIFKLADCRKDTSEISIFLAAYDRHVSARPGRGPLDSRLETAHVEVGNLEFHFLSNFVFHVLNDLDCLLGWVEDGSGRRRIRWWWKSASSGTWRVGIRFLEDGWASSGLYSRIHGIRINEKLYSPGMGCLHETQVCARLQVEMDQVDVAAPAWKIELNEVPRQERLTAERTRYVNEIKILSKLKAYRFLRHVIDHENVKEYNRIGTTPRYFDVAAVGGKTIQVRDTYFPIRATDREKESIRPNFINTLETWTTLIVGPMRDLDKDTPPLYTIRTDRVKDAEVWKFDVPVVVTGNGVLKTLTYEVACSRDLLEGDLQESEDEDPQPTQLFSAWVKQCYLHPAPDEDLVTNFGNYACFAKNLVGIIQKSADPVPRAEAVDPKFGEAEPPPDDDPSALRKYLQLCLWNEQTSLLVREFKRRLERSSYYGGGLPDLKDRNLEEKDLVECVRFWLRRGCDDYLAFHEDPKTWTPSGHNKSGVDRVTAIRGEIDGLDSLDAVDGMFTQLIRHRKVNGTEYPGDPCATRQTSFFPIFLYYVSRYALNKLGDRSTIAEKIRTWARGSRNENKITKFLVRDLTVVTARNYADLVKTFVRHYS